jgi:hypothetical protein
MKIFFIILGVVLNLIIIIWVILVSILCAPFLLLIKLLQNLLPLPLRADMWLKIVGLDNKIGIDFVDELSAGTPDISPIQQKIAVWVRLIIRPLVFVFMFFMFFLPLPVRMLMASFLMKNTLHKAHEFETILDDNDDDDIFIDLSIPRRPYVAQQLEDPEVCPSCQSCLVITQFCDYLVFAGDLDNPDMTLLGCDAGAFCSECPAVVLDMEKIVEKVLGSNEQDAAIGVIGIIDWDGAAAEKDVQMVDLDSEDDEEAPLRVITFLKSHVSEPVRNVHKIGRNDPCPCGSGKKYKKCCMN